MKKLILGLTVLSTFYLSACGDETIEDVKNDVANNGPLVIESSRVLFDPSAGNVSVPNDLLFQDTLDGTLNLPVDDATDGSDPYVALSALDGWSTSHPFSIQIVFPEERELDESTLLLSESVRIYKAVMGGDLTDSDCAAVSRGLACKIESELVLNQDFVTQKLGNNIVVIPLSPLEPKTTYLLALTNHLEDNEGKALYGSVTYELVRQDIAAKPLGTEAQLGLQAVINSYEAVISNEGVEKDSFIYTAAITTQSTSDVLTTIKGGLAANLANGISPSIEVVDSGLSVATVLTGIIPVESEQLYSLANYMTGSIDLPYYSGVPSESNPMAPINTWWTSLCDSAAMLAGYAAGGGVIPEPLPTASDATCIAVSEAAGLPAPGLRDIGIDKERHLTKFSPVAKVTQVETLDVQVTTPDPDSPSMTTVTSGLGLPPLVEPDNGWPVVILNHGITSTKEAMLSLTGLLSAFGFATVAIDLPLHGSRGFDLNGDDIDEINASTVSATHFMNLASLLTTRDNLRQNSADLLGLRLGINTLTGEDSNSQAINIDANQVFFVGHSLGAITGINFIALTNTPLDPAIDPLFDIKANSLGMPGSMLVNLLLESPDFSNTIKAQLTYKQSVEFQAYVAAVHDGSSLPSETELTGYFIDFYAAISPSQQLSLNALFAQFTFAAQTVVDSGDPVNSAQLMAATNTPTHLIEVVGNGSDNLPDQVIPNQVSTSPLSGTEAAISLLGLPGVSETSSGSGAVRFVNGRHESLLTVKDEEGFTTSPEVNAQVTQEMQTQVATFLKSSGQQISVSNPDLVK